MAASKEAAIFFAITNMKKNCNVVNLVSHFFPAV